MFKHYLSVTLRNILRHKFYTLINISGLAVGMACVVLIALFIREELSYDQTHLNADRIYRVIRETRAANGSSNFNEGTSGALAPTLQTEYQDIEKAIRVWNKNEWIEYGATAFFQTVCLADPEILDVFTFPLIKGDPTTALREPNTILITESMAQKYFGDEDPIGKTMGTKGRHFGATFTVTGILQDIPENATLQFDMLMATPVLSRSTIRLPWAEWNRGQHWFPVQTFVLLSKNASPGALEQKLPDVVATHFGADVRDKTIYHLQPLNRIHLYGPHDYNLRRTPRTNPDLRMGTDTYGDITQIYLLTTIGLLILLIACINFTNLSTARASERTREVGMRKVVGAYQRQLMAQYLSETVLFACLALGIALVLVTLALPAFNAFADRNLTLHFSHLSVLAGLLGLAVCVGLLAGSYPAFFLAAFQPAQVLKGRAKNTEKGQWLRKALVVFQFTASVLLAISTLIVYQQLTGMTDRNLGFHREQIVMIPIFEQDRRLQMEFEGPLTKKFRTVKQAFLQHPDILHAASCNTFGPFGGNTHVLHPEDQPQVALTHHVISVDEGFLDALGLELLSGRNFSADRPSDVWDACLLNETAVRQLGWKEPLGKQVKWSWRKATVIGVVKDFNNQTLHHNIGPVSLSMWRPKFKYLVLRVQTQNLDKTLAFMETTWRQFLPNADFEYRFLDSHFDKLYHVEKRLGKIFGTFSALAIFIACLGLLGLAAFTAQQRTKEIGVRKVLGASVPNLVALLSKDFIYPVIIANLIAWPVAYGIMNRWLENFAYRIDLTVWPFLLSGMAALVLALTTVSYQAFKAANTDPVDTLRDE